MRFLGYFVRLTSWVVTLLVSAQVPVTTQVRPTPLLGRFGVDMAGMDTGVRPGDDFNRYVNGTYLKNLVIPEDRSSSSQFSRLEELSQERTRAIVEALAATSREAGPGSEERKIGDFYASYMDEATIERNGLAPVASLLGTIQGIRDRAGLAACLGRLARLGVNLPLDVEAQQDLKHPDRFVIYVNQGNLGLPDRDFYLDQHHATFTEIREKYRRHAMAMLGLAGIPDAKAKVRRILALETHLARIQWDKVALRDTSRQYHPLSGAGLGKAYPGLDWEGYLAALGIPPQRVLIVSQPSAVRGTAKCLSDQPLTTWKDYLALRVLDTAAPGLPKAFVAENFAFYGTVLSGQPLIQPRWKRGVDAVSEALGEAIGKRYVEKYFPPESKRAADLLVKNLLQAMDLRLSRNPWMDSKTREMARSKLAGFTAKIGYPERWRDYTKLEVVPGDVVGNTFRAAEFAYQRQLDKVGRSIDRSEWDMTPMTINAYANLQWNEVVFPAAILQPPFFDASADPAVNYGAIGAIIGHEISHHFDDQGRKFDKEGRLSEWWTARDVKQFNKLADKMVRQYGAYEPLPGTKVNGRLTLGENIADLAGLNAALDAYHLSQGGRPAPILEGTTGDQRFFLGFGQAWRGKYRKEAMLEILTTDPHAPAPVRVNVVRNLDAWYKAFGVKEDQALYLGPEDRILMW